MALDFATLSKIAEGKTKIIYDNPADDKTVYMCFKDDITAGDGLKHDILEGKATIDWRINRDIFEYLNRAGICSHYLDSPEERVVLVKKLDLKIELEVVTRRVATGSIVGWGNVIEGTHYNPVVTQFHYKDDSLHDPMLDESYIEYITKTKGSDEFRLMREMNVQIFHHLEQAFAHFDIQLIDFKLEYGLIDGQVHLIDEITGGSFRLWPYAHPNPNLNQSNLLQELDPHGRLDKDLYRMGEAMDTVKAKFAEIASITTKFKEINP